MVPGTFDAARSALVDETRRSGRRQGSRVDLFMRRKSRHLQV